MELAGILERLTQLRLVNIPACCTINYDGKRPACWHNLEPEWRGLNSYLYQIRAAPSDECPCERANETVEHFLFRCVKWTTYRSEMLEYTEEKRGNLSFHLGGKAALDGQK
ncbi:reverse transcriptase [Fusarium oxysporum f. sp. phaseoli]